MFDTVGNCAVADGANSTVLISNRILSHDIVSVILGNARHLVVKQAVIRVYRSSVYLMFVVLVPIQGRFYRQVEIIVSHLAYFVADRLRKQLFAIFVVVVWIYSQTPST